MTPRERVEEFEARIRQEIADAETAGLRYDPTPDAPVTTVPDAPVTTLPEVTRHGAAVLAEKDYYEWLGLRVTAWGEIRGMMANPH